jgi:IMP dehydrogenase
MKEHFTFDDVLLRNVFSNIKSRKDVDIKTSLSNITLDLPVISANMSTITESDMAKEIVKHGGMSILHRFCDTEFNINLIKWTLEDYKTNEERKYILENHLGVSIGVTEKERKRAEALFDYGARIFCIDVARGASQAVVDQALWLREEYGDSIFIIVGNFCTPESILEFKKRSLCAPDIYKVGVGPGSVCTTRSKTGVGFPQLSAIIECAKVAPIIADGGMKTPGDVCKALAAGAKAVMLGNMLAGTDKAAGTWFRYFNDRGESQYSKNPPENRSWMACCRYEGSASNGYGEGWKTSEGVSRSIPYKGKISDILKDIEGGLRSSMTYLNAINLTQYRKNAEFIKVTSTTLKENGVIYGAQ